MKNRNKIIVAGMAVYCTAVCTGFSALCSPADAVEPIEIEEPKINIQGLTQYVDPVNADTLVHINPEVIVPPEENKSHTIDNANVIENCTVTYYCAERYPHICGTGDGITATGTEAIPGVTCAVDPSVIPYGSIVTVDYGDGALHEYIAQDAGAWIDGQHIDICVDKHTEALELGKAVATVYWR